MNATPSGRITAVGLMLFAVLVLWPAGPADAVRLKDLASVKGVRSNQLVGYGLVVGLKGTGDGNNASFTAQGLKNMLENMGVHVGDAAIQVKNVAGVMVTATLPPFVKPGQTIDVVISSLGDSSSLQGGTLIATPLKGLDGKVYAMAQGPISIGGFEVEGGGTATAQRGVQRNHLTVARIPSGATVERTVDVTVTGKEEFTLSLNTADFTTISRMVAAVNTALDGPYAKAQDGATVTIKVPEGFKGNEVGLLATIEALDVVPDAMAKVVLDERTGTVVMGENVRVSRIALSHGNLSLQVKALQTQGMATDALITEMTNSLSNENIMARERENRFLSIPPGTTMGELVRALNSIGVTPRDLIAIFQSIKASGALQAELEII